MTRRIVANLFSTLDGVVEAPEKWSLDYWNDDIAGAMQGGMFDADILLLGRITYEQFADSWGSRDAGDDPGTVHMNSVRKYVASRTLSSVSWNNSELLGPDTAGALRALIDDGDGDIAVSGSPTLVRWLLDQDLLDELSLLVYPRVLGSGTRLFDGSSRERTLALASCIGFDNGVVHLVYRRP